MLEKYFKNSSEVFAKPFIKTLKYLNLKPNTVSIFGLAVIIAGSYCFYLENRNLGIVLIFLVVNARKTRPLNRVCFGGSSSSIEFDSTW